MTRATLFCLVSALLLPALAASAADSRVNAHKEPASCPSCHAKIPTADDARVGDYFFTKDTLDDTCHTCHEYGCCKPGSLHGGNHPSNINNWDWKKFRRPQTLPLFNGYITCGTCHTHRDAQGSLYKLVRIVEIEGTSYTWTKLCKDCHADY